MKIEKGNAVFYGIHVLFICLVVLGCIQVSKAPVDRVKFWLINMNLVSLALMLPYRIYLVTNKEYHQIAYGDMKKPWLSELPFFPCNTAEILFCLAIFTENRMILAYCFFLGLVGTIAAFLNPPKGFESGSFFSFRIFCFYVTHYFCLMNMPLMLVSGFYVPGYLDVVKAVGFYACISLVMYFFNIYLNKINPGMNANYFFNMDPDYHPLFRKCYNLIPHRYLFTIPAMGIILVALMAVTFVIQLIF